MKFLCLLIDFMAIPPGLWLRQTDDNDLQVSPQNELATRFDSKAQAENAANLFASVYGKGKKIMFMYVETKE